MLTFEEVVLGGSESWILNLEMKGAEILNLTEQLELEKEHMAYYKAIAVEHETTIREISEFNDLYKTNVENKLYNLEQQNIKVNIFILKYR